MQQLDFTAQFEPRIILPELWDFQDESVEELRQRLRAEEEKGLVLSSPTGSGKTEIAKAMIASAMLKGSRALFTVDGIDLLDQTSRRFHEAGIEHGIWGGGKNYRRNAQIVIAMVQTLVKMEPAALLAFLESFDVVFNDECHVIFRRLAEALPQLSVPHIGLTATPISRGLGRIYKGGLVQVTTTNKLLAAERLAPLVFRASRETEIDMTDAPVSSGGSGPRRRSGSADSGSSGISSPTGSRRSTPTSEGPSRRWSSPPPSRTARSYVASSRPPASTSGR